jgi:hypothetical protein
MKFFGFLHKGESGRQFFQQNKNVQIKKREQSIPKANLSI